MILCGLNIPPKCHLCHVNQNVIWLQILFTCPNQLLSQIHTKIYNKVVHTICYANLQKPPTFSMLQSNVCWHSSHELTWQHTTLMATPMHMLYYEMWIPLWLDKLFAFEPIHNNLPQPLMYNALNSSIVMLNLQTQVSNSNLPAMYKNIYLLPTTNGWKIASLIAITSIICGTIHIPLFGHLDRLKIPLAHIINSWIHYNKAPLKTWPSLCLKTIEARWFNQSILTLVFMHNTPLHNSPTETYITFNS